MTNPRGLLPGAPSLRENFAWTLVGNGVFAASQWGAVIALARLGSPHEVGVFALALAVTAPIFLGANLHLRSVQATDARSVHAPGLLLGLRFLTTGASVIVVVAAAGFMELDRGTRLAVGVMAIAKAADSLSDLAYGGLQRLERFELISRSMALRGILGLAALVVVFAWTHSVAWSVAAMAGAWWAVLVFMDHSMTRKALHQENPLAGPIRARFEPAALVRLVRLALPLGIASLMLSLLVNIPRYFIQGFGGEEILGVFSAVSYLMVAGTMVLSALGQSSTPRMARLHADLDRAGFGRLILRLTGLSVVLGAAGVLLAWLAGGPFLRVVYGADYVAYETEFVAVMAAAVPGLVMSSLGFAVTATRTFDPQPLLLALLAGVCALACAVLVPSAGILGAAVAIGITYSVGCVLFAGLLFRATRVRSDAA